MWKTGKDKMKNGYNQLWKRNLMNIGISLLMLIFISSCNKNDEITPADQIPANIKSVNNYIWDNMDLYYLWRDFMPTDLNPNTEPDPKVFFNKLIYKPDDRWSFITEDYEALVNSFKGIEKTFGDNFQLFREKDSNKVFGIVKYVIKGSPAYVAGIKRGDVFNKINGVALDTLNYSALLFDNDSYTLGFADIVDGEAVSNGRNIELTATTVQEDPVFLDTVLEVNGRKIGYLVYTQFISDSEDELKNVFAGFKSQGITDLIVDLRYNPGGSVTTADLLSSMIAPQSPVNDQAIFLKYVWNDIVEQYWLDKDGPDSQQLRIKFMPNENNLNLDKVYILVSENSASASESVINGLKPYMDVTLIGTTTHGKYTASITLHDPQKSFNWAIQPIVLKTVNVDGNTDFKDGFAPDYLVKDDYYSPLGSLEEDMLSQAVSVITGVPADQLARKAAPMPQIGVNLQKGGSRYPEERKRVLWIDNIDLEP